MLVALGALLLAGLAMLVLPGPALVVMPIALAILTQEFARVGRALRPRWSRPSGPLRETSRSDRIVVGFAFGPAVVASILWEIPLVPRT